MVRSGNIKKPEKKTNLPDFVLRKKEETANKFISFRPKYGNAKTRKKKIKK